MNALTCFVRSCNEFWRRCFYSSWKAGTSKLFVYMLIIDSLRHWLTLIYYTYHNRATHLDSARGRAGGAGATPIGEKCYACRGIFNGKLCSYEEKDTLHSVI